jgi:hypothetical protein
MLPKRLPKKLPKMLSFFALPIPPKKAYNFKKLPKWEIVAKSGLKKPKSFTTIIYECL